MALAELSVPTGPVPTGPVGLARAAERARPVALARTRTLPVLEPLTGLLAEGGLRRGSTVALEGGPGATALGLALGAAASAAGSWLGFVGLPSLGFEAAAELGVVLARVVVVDPSAGRSRWPTVVATLLEAVDLVYVAVPGRVAGGDARRLVARARERGSVLVRLPGHDGPGSPAWPVPADVRFTVAGAEWAGPAGGGAGRLEARRVEVVAGGRGAATRERRATLWLPGPDGAVGTSPPFSARPSGVRPDNRAENAS